MVISSTGEHKEIKLDLYDKKILWELSVNSRIQKKQLANKLGISLERLHYKINRLSSEITEPVMLLNYNLLGLQQYIILVDKMDKEDLDRLIKEAPLFALIRNIGRYQYFLHVISPNISIFCEKFLPDYHLEVVKITRSIPDDNFNPFGLKVVPKKINDDKKISLDKKDYSILYSLSLDPLDPIIKISEKTKIDTKTIVSRIKKMEDSNVILKFRVAFNVYKLGLDNYTLRIRCKPKNKQKILSAIRSNRYSGFVYETYEGYFMYYMPPDSESLFEFTEQLKLVENNVKLDLLHGADFLKIQAVPKKIAEILKQRSNL